MGTLIKLLLKASDLVEAEGRTARRAVGDLGVSLILIASAALVGLLAVVALALALFVCLAEHLAPATALLCVAGALVVVALVVFAIARTISPRPRR